MQGQLVVGLEYHDVDDLAVNLIVIRSYVTVDERVRISDRRFNQANFFIDRGGNSEERYELTQQFLSQIKQRVRYIAWLNPLPRKRWAGTTAGDIARLVPMFEVSRRGLQDAIGVLRGRPTNFEGRRI
ncbi:MAG: hypothetical protein PUP92_00650 [Rhizonema sp. PD38]|nr:hypothetical protein [Rhizonema sp. PD38]